MINPSAAPHPTANNQSKRSGKAPSQSLNHLLNFSLPPRQSHYNQSIPRRTRRTGNQHGVWNKEREYRPCRRVATFSLTQIYTLSRFCECPIPLCHEPYRRLYRTLRRPRYVSTCLRYRPISATNSPTSHFQWHDILQVIIPRGHQLSTASGTQLPQEAGILTCPICLSPPIAPRMTQCGHVSLFQGYSIALWC